MNPDDLTPSDSEKNEAEGYLTGQLLIAMPSMRDPRFTRTVIYMCVHNDQGAMGLVINRLVGSIKFSDLLEELELKSPPVGSARYPTIHFGGPVETGRGFVLHSDDYLRDDSMPLEDGLALTATVDILRDIALGSGPNKAMLALGYAGWGPGQLDGELQENSWLSVEADPELLFDAALDDKWEKALAKIGISASLLSTDAGHA
ncbi:YqgE/AlgH family protein [Thalassobaculum sp.]|uniref:YqgE/AlgH family protein n=1 Tax=Thalassobaculum sp. TaxID=2022740 RepID=UPI003B5D0347